MLKQPLTIDERAALFAELNLEMVLALDTMLKGLIEEQRNPRPVAEPTPVAPVPPKEPASNIYDDDFDMIEITAHHVLSSIIRGRYVGRSVLQDGGFEALYNRIHEAILDVMTTWDMVEVEHIYEELRA